LLWLAVAERLALVVPSHEVSGRLSKLAGLRPAVVNGAGLKLVRGMVTSTLAARKIMTLSLIGVISIT